MHDLDFSLQEIIYIDEAIYKVANSPENLSPDFSIEINMGLSAISTAMQNGHFFKSYISKQKRRNFNSVVVTHSWGTSISYLPLIAKQYPNTIHSLQIYKLNAYMAAATNFRSRSVACTNNKCKSIFKKMFEMSFQLALNTRCDYVNVSMSEL
mgnify:CR=1 FL=1